MNDLEILQEMLKRSNIDYDLEQREDHFSLVVERGYIGFATCFKFSLDGKLLDMGAYE